jgi:hypothetical protein
MIYDIFRAAANNDQLGINRVMLAAEERWRNA